VEEYKKEADSWGNLHKLYCLRVLRNISGVIQNKENEIVGTIRMNREN
jgi:hypothetical protein